MTSAHIPAPSGMYDITGVHTGPESRTALCIGYSVLDLVEARHHSTHAGGTAANVAANIAWLGLSTEIIARIGQDWAGQQFTDDMVEVGVGTKHLLREAAVETPMLVHRTKHDGTPEYLFACPACRRKFAKYRPPSVDSVEKVHVSKGTLLFADRASAASIRLMERVRADDGLVFFEPNGLGRQPLTERALRLANVVKISEDRKAALSPALGAISKEATLITTRGSAGLRFRIGQRVEHNRRALRVPAIDSAGAGDWLTSGVLAQLMLHPSLHHANLNEGLRVGQWLAARSCAFHGARGMNAATTLENLLAEPHTTNGPTVVEREDLMRSGSAIVCATCQRQL